MNMTLPFPDLESLASRLQPPAWAVDEVQQRLVLLLNHVLMQEKQAQERLIRHQGKVLHLRWGVFALDLQVTPAGLTDRAAASAPADLSVTLAADSPWVLMQSLMSGKSPSVKIEGDVQFAAELGWLADNLRWDVEEDLSRIVGDAPAHELVSMARRILAGLQQFLTRAPVAAAGSSGSLKASE